MPDILAEAKELIDNVIMNGDVHDAEALLRLAETLSQTPGEHSEMVLQAAFTASNNLEPDSESYKTAISLWRQTFGALGDDSQKIAALEAMQGSVFVDTDWEQIYNEAWDSLPDSPAKRAAAKTPEFYDELRAKFAEYGVRNVDRKLAEIEKLRFDTRSWSDFVAQALAEDQILGALGNILERDLKPPQNRGDASVSQPADSQGPQQQNPQQQQQRKPESSFEQIALQKLQLQKCN